MGVVVRKAALYCTNVYPVHMEQLSGLLVQIIRGESITIGPKLTAVLKIWNEQTTTFICNSLAHYKCTCNIVACVTLYLGCDSFVLLWYMRQYKQCETS